MDSDVKIEITQDTNTNHNHSGVDLCSPFCQCHCCQIFATYLNVEELTLPSVIISTNIFLHFDSLGKDISNIILQPPKF